MVLIYSFSCGYFWKWRISKTDPRPSHSFSINKGWKILLMILYFCLTYVHPVKIEKYFWEAWEKGNNLQQSIWLLLKKKNEGWGFLICLFFWLTYVTQRSFPAQQTLTHKAAQCVLTGGSILTQEHGTLIDVIATGRPRPARRAATDEGTVRIDTRTIVHARVQ